MENDDPDYEVTECYMQFEVPVDSDSSFYTYLIQRSENTFFIAACLNDVFDSLIENFDNDLVNVYNDAWPNLITLLQNGVNDKYQNGALIKLEDQDCGENKWFLATVVGNMKIEKLDDFFNDKVVDAIKLINSKAIALFTELNDNEPSVLKAIAVGAKQGVVEGIINGVKIWLNTR
jgi:hypothetical protein